MIRGTVINKIHGSSLRHQVTDKIVNVAALRKLGTHMYFLVTLIICLSCAGISCNVFSVILVPDELDTLPLSSQLNFLKNTTLQPCEKGMA